MGANTRRLSHSRAGRRFTIRACSSRRRSPVIVGTAHGIAGEMSQERETGGSSWADAAFEDLYLGNYSRTVGVLFRLLGDHTRAEEIANDVFLKLYPQGLLPSRDGNVAGWLYRTATNLGIDALRATAGRSQNEDAAAAPRHGAGP